MTEKMNLDMPLEEAMRTQRAIRRLKPDPVDDALLLHLIELALKAPVGTNAQAWSFMIVKDRRAIAEIARMNRLAVKLYLGIGRRLMRRHPKMLRIIDAVQWQADHFDEIPAIVIPCYRGNPSWLPFIGATSWYGSVYPAVQNFLLAARAANLGAALITLPLWNLRRVKRLLGIPRSITPVAMIPVGWPMGRYGPTTRRPVEEVVHVDRYGHRPFHVDTTPPPEPAAPRSLVAAGVLLGAAAGFALFQKWSRDRDR